MFLFYADVPATDPIAVYIRIATREGWMSGYLGGKIQTRGSGTLQRCSESSSYYVRVIRMMILQEIWFLPVYPSSIIWN